MDDYKHTFNRFHGYIDLGFIKNGSVLIEIEANAGQEHSIIEYPKQRIEIL